MCSRCYSICSRPGLVLASAWVHWLSLSLLPVAAGWGIASGLLRATACGPTMPPNGPRRSPKPLMPSLYSLPGMPLLRPSMRRSGLGKPASLSVVSRSLSMRYSASPIAAVLSILALAACSSVPSARILATPTVPSVCRETCQELPMPPEAGQPEASLNLWVVELIRSAEACAAAKADCAAQLQR